VRIEGRRLVVALERLLRLALPLREQRERVVDRRILRVELERFREHELCELEPLLRDVDLTELGVDAGVRSGHANGLAQYLGRVLVVAGVAEKRREPRG